MWKKILYFGIAIVIGILVYIIGYSSNQMNHLEGIVKNAIASEEYYKVPMVWGGCFDSKSIADNNSDKLDLMIYPATSQTEVTYGDEENSSRFLEFERAYYVYIFNAKFSVDTATDGTSSFNKTAIEFASNDAGSSSYDYYFIVNETVNSSQYIKEPTSAEEALLNNEREVSNTNSTWNFMRITFTETMLKQISKEINGGIHKLSVKDCDGSVVYSIDINLDFSQDFFKATMIDEVITKYNKYLDDYMAAEGDSSKLKEINSTWGKEFEDWKAEFKENSPTTGYVIGYERDVVTPSKLVWQTVGMMALYVLVIALFYILLFHFGAVKRIFSRENYKDYSSDDSQIIVNGKVVSRKKGQATKEIKAEDVVVPDTTADDTLETVTALEATQAVAESVVENVEEEKPEEVQEEIKPVEVIEEAPKVEDEPASEPVLEEAPVQEVTPVEESAKEEKPAPKKPAAKKSTTSTTTKKTSTTAKKSTASTTAKKTSTTTKKSTTKKAESKTEGE
ncbi:MAG: hypothetical protein K2N42_04805 [Anaeroplasmataceae bacterium]|nr:hypothetical protein [Anaeroplasmataceae bacterium]